MKETDWLTRNPFTDDYMKEEVEFYNCPSYEKDEIVVSSTVIQGRCADYLNKSYRNSDVSMPRLFIDDKMWMSISFMEVQSHYLPILLANGTVGTCGLGLGYFTLRTAEKENVEKVIVFEQQERIVKFFKEKFKDRPGFDKIEFILGDAREKCRGYYFDFLFVDIYQTSLPDEILSDIKLFVKNNDVDIDNYLFWGLERIILDANQYDLIESEEVRHVFREYFTYWFNTPFSEDPDLVARLGEVPMLSGLYEPGCDSEFAAQVMHAMGYDVDKNAESLLSNDYKFSFEE